MKPLLIFSWLIILRATSWAIAAAVCPTPGTTGTREAWLAYAGKGGLGRDNYVALLLGDGEYRSKEAIPHLGKVVATAMGSATGLATAGTRRMMFNRVFWSVGLEQKIAAVGIKVDLVGDHHPSSCRFLNDENWRKKSPKPFDCRKE